MTLSGKRWPKQELVVSYSQLAIFNTGMEHPFSDWRDEHIMQGFTWREGSVSFGTLADRTSEVEVAMGESVSVGEDAVRAIVVPFAVGGEGITISSILSAAYDMEVPQGSYALLFEAVLIDADAVAGPAARYRFTFVPSEQPEPAILKRDEELSPPEPLLMEAEAAV
ncbi:competence protein [Paenibacillus swuensis]|uniref:Competence protein n=1 Tax=Paenibacillus swuensis TaxID=1178515 RepID=A0A172TFG8_9BACL|nr:competence protein ComJ [Paenibacillus swuensis]ANE45702.1 competence protein [Paenibacillus swuensis]